MTSADETYDIQSDLDAALADPVRAARIEHFYRAGEVALALYALREALSSTQEEFAAAAHMSQENLSRIERSPDVKISTILRLLDAGGARVELNALLPDGRTVGLFRNCVVSSQPGQQSALARRKALLSPRLSPSHSGQGSAIGSSKRARGHSETKESPAPTP
jgi:transcriptional regulator with XRE-family HTH domain